MRNTPVDGVVVGKLFGDLTMRPPFVTTLVAVDVEAAFDVAIDREAACAARGARRREAGGELRRVQMVRHGEQALTVDVVLAARSETPFFA
jgi:hypothetical protein